VVEERRRALPLNRPSQLRTGCSLALFALFLNALLGMETDAYAQTSAKRVPPNYDGRGSPTTVGEKLIWIPRIAVSPLYFVTEFVVRRPLGAFVSWAERSGAPKVLYDFFAFGPNHSIGILPLAYVQFGFNPSVGLLFFWNDAGLNGHDVSIQGSTWGRDWLALVVNQRVRFFEQSAMKFQFTALRRPDYRFHGLGPDSSREEVTRFGQDTVSSRLAFESTLSPAHSGYFESFFRQRAVSFYEGRYDEDPGLVAQAVRTGRATPSAFNSGLSVFESGIKWAFDTRPAKEENPSSGLRFEGDAMYSADVRAHEASSWVTYGGTLGGLLALTGRGRVVGLSATAHFADRTGSQNVPFSELVEAGGEGPLRGFAPGRLRGQSVAATTIRYHWPIWIDLEGTLDASVGNVFGEHLQGFSVEKLRLSSGIGVATSSKPDSAFQLLIGLGTDTFEHGAGIDSVRLVIGSHRGL
jgi:hypothetical protein